VVTDVHAVEPSVFWYMRVDDDEPSVRMNSDPLGAVRVVLGSPVPQNRATPAEPIAKAATAEAAAGVAVALRAASTAVTVALVPVAAPSTGVISVGVFASTTAPEPVELV